MTKRTTFATLDGLRGLAAVAVFTRHVPSQSWAWWLPGSYFAVDLFFMISGFVLAHAYGERLNCDLSVGRFLLARVIRLWPMYILGTFVGLIVRVGAIAAGQPIAWQGLVPSALFGLFMLPTPASLSGVATPFPLNGPAWSLFWELVISIVFTVLGPRMRPAWVAVVIAVGAGMLVATAAAFGSLDSGFNWDNFLGGGGRVGFTFFAGVAIYRVQQARPVRGTPAWVWAFVLGAVFAGHVAPAWRASYDLLMVFTMFPMIVYMGACREPQGWMRWMALALGKISYPLYVMQSALIAAAALISARLFGLEFSALSHVGTFGLLASCMGLALVLARFHDEPVRGWLTRRSRLGTTSVRAAEAAAP